MDPFILTQAHMCRVSRSLTFMSSYVYKIFLEFVKVNFKLNDGSIATSLFPKDSVQGFIDQLGSDNVWLD